jgi:hypothetical protein
MTVSNDPGLKIKRLYSRIQEGVFWPKTFFIRDAIQKRTNMIYYDQENSQDSGAALNHRH